SSFQSSQNALRERKIASDSRGEELILRSTQNISRERRSGCSNSSWPCWVPCPSPSSSTRVSSPRFDLPAGEKIDNETEDWKTTEIEHTTERALLLLLFSCCCCYCAHGWPSSPEGRMDDDLRLTLEVARGDLVHRLESLPGPKHLLVEQCLIRPLDKVASMSLLSKHGCVRVFTISKDGSLPSSELDIAAGQQQPQRATRVFLMRCSLPNARLLAAFLRSDEVTPAAVIWVDRLLPMADRELERAGVYGAVDQSSLALPMLPIEADLFSLELPQSRQTEYYSVAQSLYQLQSLYGQFPTVYGVGEAAERVSKMMKVIYADRGEPRALADQPISHLFLLDRNLDPASVLMSGLTYESMLHDAFRIRCGKVQFGPEVEERLRASMKETKEEGGGGGG
ncbi:hypothetical protein PMAYCL1PPCAC_01432, partial [Pristionchus mayeri]